MIEQLSNHVKSVVSQAEDITCSIAQLSHDHMQQIQSETSVNLHKLLLGIGAILASAMFLLTTCVIASFALHGVLQSTDLSNASIFGIITLMWLVLTSSAAYAAYAVLKDVSVLPKQSLQSLSETFQWILKN